MRPSEHASATVRQAHATLRHALFSEGFSEEAFEFG